MTGHRPRFQFSLRKLLLWTVVWALFLSVMRAMWSPVAIAVSLYGAILLGIRVVCGFDRGRVIAVVLTSLTPVIFAAVLLWCWLAAGMPVTEVTLTVPVFLFFWVLIGLHLAYWSFMLVHGIVNAVDWLDSLLQPKTEIEP